MNAGEFLRNWTLTHSWFSIFLISCAGFALIYFSLAFLALLLTDVVFPMMRIGNIIDSRPHFPHQVRDEIRRSLASIGIFGLYGVATIFLDQKSWLHIRWETHWARLPLDLVFFGLWNEIHFYISHRLLHTRWLYRRVHHIHHQSVIPTPFSTYSFHPVEAALLGSVMITGMFFYSFSIAAIILAPLESLILNVIGHWNYDPFPGKPLHSLLASSRRHSLHHSRVTGNFGFMLPFLDEWFNTGFQGSAQVQQNDTPTI